MSIIRYELSLVSFNRMEKNGYEFLNFIPGKFDAF